MAFNAAEHIIQLKGKDYLEVKWRLVWFREDHPAASGWGIQTKCLIDEGQAAVFQASIIDPEGRIVAMGTKQESRTDFGDFREKAETGSIGRALATLGYGTQFAPELDEGERIVDSPVEKRSSPAKANFPPITGPKAAPKTPVDPPVIDPDLPINAAQQGRIIALAKEHGWSAIEINAKVFSKYNCKHSSEIKNKDYEAVVGDLLAKGLGTEEATD